MQPGIRLADGTSDFSAGVNCSRVPTVASDTNPNGLPRQALAWLSNGTTRGGGITPRWGWQPRIRRVSEGELFQGGCIYEPPGANPYLIALMGGRVLLCLLEEPYTVTDLSAISGLSMPATATYAHFVQAEEFLVIQAGDGVTLPLFWDGVSLTRSHGLTGDVDGANVSQLPAAFCMCYYGGRIWYAQDRVFTAGDIARGAAGTAAYDRRDSVLCVTENPLAFKGDGFSVPINAGGIRALSFPANIDTTLGQGPLLIGTRKAIYSLEVPVTRNDWIGATSNQPKQVVAQFKWGPVNDRSIVHVNGDLFYQTLEPGIRSFAFARRNYGQWANVPISSNVNRALRRNDRGLLRYSTGMNFDNRLWQSALPHSTPLGVAHRAIVPLDFDPLSSIEQQLPPVWEGNYEGKSFLQLYEGDFGGLQRAFALAVSDDETTIDLWELTSDEQTENGDNRIPWYFESPAFTWSDTIGEKVLKKLVSAEISFDRIYGKAQITVEWRPDSDPCWRLWHDFAVCSARSPGETPGNVIAVYPEADYLPGYQTNKVLPHPNGGCSSSTGRPSDLAYQHQVRVTIKGWVRVRSLFLWAESVERPAYFGQVC